MMFRFDRSGRMHQRGAPSRVSCVDIRSRLVNDLGDEIGAETRTLTVARVSVSANNQYYYGHLSGDPDYFLLDRYAAEWFAASLLEKED